MSGITSQMESRSSLATKKRRAPRLQHVKLDAHEETSFCFFNVPSKLKFIVDAFEHTGEIFQVNIIHFDSCPSLN